MTFTDYLNEGNFKQPFEKHWVDDYTEIRNLAEGIEGKRNIINLFLYYNILTYAASQAIPEINEFIENNYFDKVKEGKIKTTFYLPKKLGNSNIKDVIQNLPNLFKKWCKGISKSFNKIEIIGERGNTKQITATGVFFVDVIGDYEFPDSKTEIKDKINSIFTKHLKKGKEIAKRLWDGEFVYEVSGEFKEPNITFGEVEVEFNGDKLSYNFTQELESKQ